MQSINENSPMATVSSINGMGAPIFPGNPTSPDAIAQQESGSGDIPYQLTGGAPEKKKKSSFKTFKEFMQSSADLRAKS